MLDFFIAITKSCNTEIPLDSWAVQLIERIGGAEGDRTLFSLVDFNAFLV